nr:hypothetical protein [Pseudogulbenkiania ferrooxidans]
MNHRFTALFICANDPFGSVFHLNVSAVQHDAVNKLAHQQSQLFVVRSASQDVDHRFGSDPNLVLRYVDLGHFLGLDHGQLILQGLDVGVDLTQPHGQIAQVGCVFTVQLEDVEEILTALVGFLDVSHHAGDPPITIFLPVVGELAHFGNDLTHALRGEDALNDGVHHPGVELSSRDSPGTTATTFLRPAAVVVVIDLVAAVGAFSLHGGATLTTPENAGKHKGAVRAATFARRRSHLEFVPDPLRFRFAHDRLM